MGEPRCRYCENLFQRSKYRAQQTVCGEPSCQRQRRADYHRQKLVGDAEYRQVCCDSSHKWRARNPDYWQGYREKNPAAVERNLQRQRVRDQRRQLRDLANNNLAFDLTRRSRNQTGKSVTMPQWASNC